MARCPECAGIMEYNSDLKMMACTSCGLTLTRTELDKAWKEIREKNLEVDDDYDKRKRKKKEWLDWYQSSDKK